MAASLFTLAISYPLCLYFLGYELYGVWLILSLVLGLAQIGLLSVSSAIIKLIAEDFEEHNIRGIKSYILMALAVVLSIGLLVLLIVLSFKMRIVHSFKLTDENAVIVSNLLPYIGLLSIYVLITMILNAVLSGLGRMDEANYITAAGRIIAMVLSILLIMAGLGVSGLVIGNAVSYIFIHGFSYYFMRKYLKDGVISFTVWDWDRFKKLMHFCGGIFGVSLVGLLLDPFNKFLLCRYAGVATVPVYDLSYRAAFQIRALIEPGVRAVMPEVSKIGKNLTSETKKRISDIQKRLFKLVFKFVLPGYVLICLLAGIFLKLWLQDRYVEQLPGFFRITLIASFISLLGLPMYYINMGLGRVGVCLVAHILISAINVIMGLIFVFLCSSSVEVRIYFSVLLGHLGSTIYLFRYYKHK